MGARGAGFGVVLGLDAAPLGGLVAAPRDTQRRGREQQHRDEFEYALPPANDGVMDLRELVRRVDMDVFRHDPTVRATTGSLSSAISADDLGGGPAGG